MRKSEIGEIYDFRIVGERITHRNFLNQQNRSLRPQSWTSTISTDSIRSCDTTTDRFIIFFSFNSTVFQTKS